MDQLQVLDALAVVDHAGRSDPFAPPLLARREYTAAGLQPGGNV